MQLLFVEFNLVQFNIDVQATSSLLKSSVNISLNHYLVDHPGDCGQEYGYNFIIIAWSFVLICLFGI
jgi:hypothetical protein